MGARRSLLRVGDFTFDADTRQLPKREPEIAGRFVTILPS